MLGDHAGFILAAYGLSALIVLALVVWVVVDGRTQRRRLADLEARGIRRRSRRAGSEAESGAGEGRA
ncbi:heme exporter protein CcmD [Kaistia geumhonensis]|uniref:Heme exporter protein D n=1 Tax=Kaistia geumhonensis TaxID=410839 RepID=A0ABU0M7X7_9HYPH|nr:heme exporter protein CcmD [Kaistia geumhonensis]MCX5477720.1 heme exporter protein CcmD [Kaistia geumhonensis]MDQ0517069.1 heme exporter protein D [Kaistia geumhonensis]